MLIFAEIFWDLLRSAEIHWGLLTFWDLLISAKICWDLLRSAKICWDLQRYHESFRFATICQGLNKKNEAILSPTIRELVGVMYVNNPFSLAWNLACFPRTGIRFKNKHKTRAKLLRSYARCNLNFQRAVQIEPTMRKNLPKLLDLLIFCIYSLNFSLEFFIMIVFVTNQLNISKFLPPQIRKTLISY